MILGYKGLAVELGGLYSVGALSVADCRGKLPLSKCWHQGRRVFDAVEVQQFKVDTQARMEKRK